MRKYMIAIMLLLISITVTGCFSGHVHYTINNDDSGDISIKLAVDSALAGFLGEGMDPFEDVVSEAKESGFQVSRFNEDGLMGIETKKHYSDCQQMFAEHNFLGTELGSKSNDVKIEKGFFLDTYKLETAVDMTDMAEGADDEISRSVLSQIKFDFILTLPAKATTHNASKVSDDERTYIWNLMAGQDNDIVLEAQKLNVTNIVLTVIAGIAVLVGLAVLMKKSKTRVQESVETDV